MSLLIHSCCPKKGGFLLKLDFFKAFDKVSWGFIDELLEKFGFGIKWRRWLLTCWKTASFAVLLNGSPGDSFKSTCGFRQGDPLSPMIFVLAAEVLNLMVMKLQSERCIDGFKVSASGVPILQFADDTLLLINGGFNEAKTQKNTLCWFAACSGLHINASKTKTYKVNKVNDWVDILAFWKCSLGAFLYSYLGLPLGAKYKSTVVWEAIIEKFRTRIAL